jgi:hypothetical protein
LASIWTIKRTVTESSAGPTVEVTRATGKTESNTARACTLPSKGLKSTANGKMESATVGLEEIVGNEEQYTFK